MTTSIERSRSVVPPTVDDVRLGLQRTLGCEFVTVWAAVCATLAVAPEITTLPADRFDELLTAVSHHDRLCHVLAMSWRIRCTAARKLAELDR